MKSRFTINRILPLVCIAFLLSFSTFAQQTKKISLQGLLKDGNGKAVADGAYNASFSLYTLPSGGEAVWTESQSIAIKGGIYSAAIGKTQSLDDPKLSWGANTYYVGVSINGVELNPRTELTFAPYSLGSPIAEYVRCSGAVGDIKYSILKPSDFAKENGDCWVPMDGEALPATSKLKKYYTAARLPDGGGMFIRSQEFEVSNTDDNNDPDRDHNSAIAQRQEQSYQSHSHPFSATFSATGTTSESGEHTHKYNTNEQHGRESDSGNDEMYQRPNDFDKETSRAGNHTHTVTVSGTASGTTQSTGTETRPKNLNFYIYIRIN